MTYQAAIIYAVLVLACIVEACAVGYYRGRANGWQEGYFDRDKSDRFYCRRYHFGRFRAKHAPKDLHS